MTRLKTCPICEHTQSKDDPTGHVCAQVLRARLREAQGQLDAIRVIVENDDPVAAVRLLKIEHEAIPRLVDASRIAGMRYGRADAVKILERTIASAPFWKRWLLLGQYALIRTLSAHPDDKRRIIQGEA